MKGFAILNFMEQNIFIMNIVNPLIKKRTLILKKYIIAILPD